MKVTGEIARPALPERILLSCIEQSQADWNQQTELSSQLTDQMNEDMRRSIFDLEGQPAVG